METTTYTNYLDCEKTLQLILSEWCNSIMVEIPELNIEEIDKKTDNGKYRILGQYFKCSPVKVENVVINGELAEVSEHKPMIKLYNGGMDEQCMKHELIHHLFSIKRNRLLCSIDYMGIPSMVINNYSISKWYFKFTGIKDWLFEIIAKMDLNLRHMGYSDNNIAEERRVRQLEYKDWGSIKLWFESNKLY